MDKVRPTETAEEGRWGANGAVPWWMRLRLVRLVKVKLPLVVMSHDAHTHTELPLTTVSEKIVPTFSVGSHHYDTGSLFGG